MKSTPTAREVALSTLNRIERNQAYSNLALQKELAANHHLSQLDKAFVTELVYGTIQRLNTLDYAISRCVKQPLHKLDVEVLNLLRLGTYQIFFLDRVPVFAAIHESVELIKRKKQRLAGFVNAVLRNIQRNGKRLIQVESGDPIETLAIETSHPRWLIELWIGQYGIEATRKLCLANLERAHQSLRVNTNRITREACIERLRKAGLDVRPSTVIPEAIEVVHGTDITTIDAFQEGLVTVQDESSMLVAYCLDASPNQTVLDACAAPGGKTTHIAQFMQDTGRIVACDIHPHKIQLIQNALARLKLSCVHPVACDARQLSASEYAFDRILLDAPCSGLGVLRRKPDIKWSKVPDEFTELVRLQKDLLDHMAVLLKPGGVMVYSTCTLHAKENHLQVEQFLLEHPDFELESVRDYVPERVRPLVSERGFLEVQPFDLKSDGFFIARMRRRK
jgi:16S rRNA (cytosine967-C5)-methyltransferase